MVSVIYDKQIAAAVQRRAVLGGGKPLGDSSWNSLLRDRMEVLSDSPDLPVGIAREPLAHLAQPGSLNLAERGVLIGPDPTRAELRLAWAIMANIPLHPLTRGPCGQSSKAQCHFGRREYDPYPLYAGSSQEAEDRRWWGELIGTIIGVDPKHLLTWLVYLRAEDRLQTFRHLIAMDLWRAVEADKTLLDEPWPPLVRDPPDLRPLNALANFYEFVRIAQLQRAMLRRTYATGKEMTADGVVKALKADRRHKRASPNLCELKWASSLQTLAFGVPVDREIEFDLLQERLFVRMAAHASDGSQQAEFFGPRKPAEARVLAGDFADHPLYRPQEATKDNKNKKLKKGQEETPRDVVRRTSAVTYWGLDHRHLPGALLLDLWMATRKLTAKSNEKSSGYVPMAVRNAIVQLTLVWLEQESTDLLARQVRAMRKGSRRGSDYVMPADRDYRPSLVVDASPLSSAKKLQDWKAKASKLPEIGQEGSLNRARPDRWLWHPSDEELRPLRASQSFVIEGLPNFVPKQVGLLDLPPRKSGRGASYRAALRDAQTLSTESLSLEGSADPICVTAVVNLSLTLSPLSLDPERDLTNPRKRRLAIRKSEERSRNSQEDTN